MKMAKQTLANRIICQIRIIIVIVPTIQAGQMFKVQTRNEYCQKVAKIG